MNQNQLLIILTIIVFCILLLSRKYKRVFKTILSASLSLMMMTTAITPIFADEQEEEIVEEVQEEDALLEEETFDDVLVEEEQPEEVEEIIDVEDDYKEFEEEQEDEEENDFEIDETYVNPLYADVLSAADLNAPVERSKYRKLANQYPYFTDPASATQYIRNQMKLRNTEVIYQYEFDKTTIGDQSVNAYSSALSKQIMANVFAHTGNPKEGDYLRWQYGGYHAGISGDVWNNSVLITVSYTFTYYTTLEQENAVDATVQSILNTLNVQNKSPYERVKSIYTYICNSTSYDYSTGDGTYTKYSAYGALINQKCVCQGYSNALYRLCLEAGVDCRIVTGSGNGSAHAWNIVGLDGLYYNLDATWDAGRSKQQYFLQGESTFGKNHSRGTDCSTEYFLSAYPTSYIAYDPVNVVPLVSIKINQGNIERARGANGTLTVTYNPDNTSEGKFAYWSSSNPNVVTIDEYGNFNCIAIGTSQITARSITGKTDTITITVKEKPYTVAFEQSSTTLEMNRSKDILPVASLEDVHPTFTWKSSNTNIVQVEDGTITGISKGTAKITATAANGTSCSINVTVVDLPIESIAINEPAQSKVRDQSGDLTVTITPEDTTISKGITWTSSNPSVVTVDANGHYTCVGVGEATITAKSSNGKMASVQVKSVEKFYKIVMRINTVYIDVFEKYQFEPVPSIDDVTPTYTWESSNPSVATVDQNGVVTGISAGKAIITAYAENGEPAVGTLTVKDTYIKTITIDRTNYVAEKAIGDKGTLTYTVSPSLDTISTDKTITWSSNNPSVITVDQNGNYECVGYGSARILATAANGVSGSISFDVVDTNYTISLNKHELPLSVGSTFTLKATNSNKTIVTTYKWESSDSSVASVSNSGRVTALKPGVATITCTTGNGKSDSCLVLVDVQTIDITSISFNVSSFQARRGDSGSIIATVYPSTTTMDKSLTWSSSNPNVVSIDQNGNYKALEIGTSTISATSTNGISKAITITVREKDYSISLDQSILSLPVSSIVPLNAIISEPDVSQTVTWTSSDTKVATVTSGRVKGLSVGTATITAKAANGKTATCTVTVTDLEIASVAISNHQLTKLIGATGKVSATISPSGTTLDKKLTWTSSNPEIVEVDADGNYTCKDLGMATLTVTTVNGKQDTMTINVVRTTISNGWYTEENGDKYYYVNKEPTIGWKAISSKWYYFDEAGVMQTGPCQIGDEFYVLSNEGAMLTGWQQVGDIWYCLDASGKAYNNWQTIGTKVYYFDEYKMVTGYQVIDKVQYYFNDSGSLFTGWKNVDEIYYYFTSNGAIDGWKKINNVWYYFDDYKMVTGYQVIDNVPYFFNSSGALFSGWKELEGNWYYFTSSGAIKGWKYINTKWYYFNEKGVMVEGIQEIDGKLYDMTTGAMRTTAAWYKNEDGSYYYFQANGTAASGWFKVGTKWYYFKPNTKLMACNETLTDTDGITYVFDAKGGYKKV